MTILSKIFIKTCKSISFTQVFCREQLKKFIYESGLQERERIVNYCDSTVAMISYCSLRQNTNSRCFTIKDFTNYYCNLFNVTISKRGFYKAISKKELTSLLQLVMQRLCSLYNKAPLKGIANDLLNHLKQELDINDIKLIDGCKIRVQSNCAENFNCSANASRNSNSSDKPCGIALHCCFSVVHQIFSHIHITEAVGSEREQLSADKYEKSLFIADRGYPSLTLQHFLESLGHYFLFRAKRNHTYIIKSAIDKYGNYITKFVGKTVKEISEEIEFTTLDMMVECPDGSQMRMIRALNLKEKGWNYVITNIPAEKISAQAICKLYRVRWAEERVYMIMKSANSLGAINSSKLEVILPFIYASFCSYIVKAICATKAQKAHNIIKEISMYKVNFEIKNIFKLLLSMSEGKKSSIYHYLNPILEQIKNSCLMSKPSTRDKNLLKDRVVLIQAIISDIKDNKGKLMPHLV